MAGWTGKKGNVVFSKPEEPSFLKKFKEKVGYKEDAGVADKFQVMPKATDEDLEDANDELPQVVQLQSGDLTQEEFEAAVVKETTSRQQEDPDGQSDVSPDGRILFRKPAKRTHDPGFERTTSTKKTKRAEGGEGDGGQSEQKERKEKRRADRKLLSFDDENEEDDGS